MANRPKQRTLVRWNDDHDKELLLWINYCCVEQGIRIPWPRIAQCMGSSFTEGACVQHLAKIRTKMEEAGLHVPPVNKRGMLTKTGSSIYRPKPKSLNSPVPRVRANVTPPSHGRYPFDDDEEEEDEGPSKLDLGGPPSGRRTARRRPITGPSNIAIKDESDADDVEPNLYDSDNEYGAKKPGKSSSLKTSDRPKIQMKIDFVNKQIATGKHQGQIDISPGSDQRDPGIAQTHQRSPVLKFETYPVDKAIQQPKQAVSQPRGARRKSSAMTEDDNDVDYEPGSYSKGRAKKPRTSRVVKKKPKDKKSTPKAQPGRQVSPYQEASLVNIDRSRMPPPSQPASSELSVEWNNNFMYHPFAIPNKCDPSQYNGQDISDGTWNDCSPAPGHFSTTFDQSQGTSYGLNLNTYPRPSMNIGYNNVGVTPSTSAPGSRNDSWASLTSTSSADGQLATWHQPVRSLSFPNPREASAVLNQVYDTEGADALTQIDIFATPVQGLVQEDMFDHVETGETGVQQGGQESDMTGEADEDALFVGLPDTAEFDMSNYLNYP